MKEISKNMFSQDSQREKRNLRKVFHPSHDSPERPLYKGKLVFSSLTSSLTYHSHVSQAPLPSSLLSTRQWSSCLDSYGERLFDFGRMKGNVRDK